MDNSTFAMRLLDAPHPKDVSDAIAKFMPHRGIPGRGAAGRPLAERLLSRVVFAMNDCWHWRSGRNNFGYGRMSYKGRQQVASRLSHMEFIGPIPEGLSVLHSCDNPSCINPEHFFLGTYSDNRRDAIAKGRTRNSDRRGFTHQSAKVTPRALEEMRRLRAIGLSYAKIGATTGLSTMTVFHAINGRFEK